MEIITTHVNADFDALASMLAAKKLYPGARLVFPGSLEKNLRDFLKATPLGLDIMRPKAIRQEEVSRVIVVDTKLSGRVGDLAALVNRPGVDLHLYDHHPHNPRDLRGSVEVLEEVGACSTIFTEILAARGIPLTPSEATILALGIYEDTGLLTFASTTPRDLTAAASLLAAGADLNIVSDYLSRDLSPEQVAVLDHLITSAERYLVNGVEVVVSTVKSDRYVGDLAVLVHKLKDMENLNVVFALIRMEGRIYLIARSRLDAVDVGEICHRFGGGGHPTAASATIHHENLGVAKRRLLAVLKEVVPPLATAREMMIAPVRSISSGTTIEEARKVAVRQGINYLPVIRDGLYVGVITLETIERAAHHGLGAGAVDGYLENSIPTVTPSTAFQEIEALVVRRGAHFIPVIDGGRIAGAITMREFLRILHDDMVKRPLFLRDPQPGGTRGSVARSVASLLVEKLPPPVLSLLKEIGQTATKSRTQAFLVGGMVRDLLVGSPTIDLDIVIEGDAISLARSLARTLGAACAVHPRFGTATMTAKDGTKVDFATARTEYYDHPAAYPTVETSSIQNDLYRRDFSINAMAVTLTSQRFGTLLDFFGGWDDLQKRSVRVLHPLSFVEDPTRIYRAVRLEQRLGFSIEEGTERLIHLAIRKKLMYRLSGKRILGELVLILREERPLPAIARLHVLKVLGLLHPSLQKHRSLPAVLRRLPETLSIFSSRHPGEEIQPWLLYLFALFDRLTTGDLAGLAVSLEIPSPIASRALHAKQIVGHWEALVHSGKEISPAAAWRVFGKAGVEEVLLALAKTRKKPCRELLLRWLETLRFMRPTITGDDLRSLGVAPGPSYGRILARVHEALLEGTVKPGKATEMALAKRLIRG
jgi:tRNA nucleotidyltransferase (CCA-adding enzyme)